MTKIIVVFHNFANALDFNEQSVMQKEYVIVRKCDHTLFECLNKLGKMGEISSSVIGTVSFFNALSLGNSTIPSWKVFQYCVLECARHGHCFCLKALILFIKQVAWFVTLYNSRIFTAVIYIHFFSLLPLFKYSFKLVRRIILLLVLEHSIHTLFAINL